MGAAQTSESSLTPKDYPPPVKYWQYLDRVTVPRLGLDPWQKLCFFNATWHGCGRNLKLAKSLGAIAVMENGPDRKLSGKKGWLGGQHKTIHAGRKAIRGRYHVDQREWQDCEALSFRFALLYHHYGALERTVRVWNLGRRWKKADDYWRSVKSLSAL